jgi:hypothetical protein
VEVSDPLQKITITLYVQLNGHYRTEEQREMATVVPIIGEMRKKEKWH